MSYLGTQLNPCVIAHSKPLTASCNDGDLKLVGGTSENEGRLEVCLNRRWGTIDGEGWTDTETEAACNQLGYSTSGIVIPPLCFKRFIAERLSKRS